MWLVHLLPMRICGEKVVNVFQRSWLVSVGMWTIAPDYRSDIGNPRDLYTLLVTAMMRIHCYSSTFRQGHLTVLPVDVTASSIVHLSRESDNSTDHVYHLIDRRNRMSMDAVIESIVSMWQRDQNGGQIRMGEKSAAAVRWQEWIWMWERVLDQCAGWWAGQWWRWTLWSNWQRICSSMDQFYWDTSSIICSTVIIYHHFKHTFSYFLRLVNCMIFLEKPRRMDWLSFHRSFWLERDLSQAGRMCRSHHGYMRKACILQEVKTRCRPMGQTQGNAKEQNAAMIDIGRSQWMIHCIPHQGLPHISSVYSDLPF